jgi:hypothetical protein
VNQEAVNRECLWVLAGDVKAAADWQRYGADFAARLRSPMEVKLAQR